MIRKDFGGERKVGEGRSTDGLLSTIAEGLSEMREALERMISVKVDTVHNVRPVQVSEVPVLTGGAERLVVATYARFGGDVTGHLAFLYDRKSAEMLIRLVTGEESVDSDMAASVICEVSNVAGSRVLNVLSDASGFRIVPTPPEMVTDMAGAVLQSMLCELAPESRECVVLRCEIRFCADGFMGTLVLFPAERDVKRLIERLAGNHKTGNGE
ncbi:MAG: chemotaxis protein CheC [Anaerolineae bacterium]